MPFHCHSSRAIVGGVSLAVACEKIDSSANTRSETYRSRYKYSRYACFSLRMRLTGPFSIAAARSRETPNMVNVARRIHGDGPFSGVFERLLRSFRRVASTCSSQVPRTPIEAIADGYLRRFCSWFNFLLLFFFFILPPSGKGTRVLRCFLA